MIPLSEDSEEMNLPEFGDRKWVRADAVKIFGDDGWERDLPPEKNGYCMFPGETQEEQGEELRRTIRELHHRGWQTAIHLTGGRGIDISVDALSEAEEEEPGRDLRHFILHASSSSKENIKKCVRHEIGCGAQAVGGYEFGGETDYKVLLDGGMLVAEGSDAPALPMNWMKGLHFLVSRRAKDGKVYILKWLLISERLSVCTQSIRHTKTMLKISAGHWKVGKCANLQVLDRNIFEIPADEIEHTEVLMTMCGGESFTEKVTVFSTRKRGTRTHAGPSKLFFPGKIVCFHRCAYALSTLIFAFKANHPAGIGFTNQDTGFLFFCQNHNVCRILPCEEKPPDPVTLADMEGHQLRMIPILKRHGINLLPAPEIILCGNMHLIKNFKPALGDYRILLHF